LEVGKLIYIMQIFYDIQVTDMTYCDIITEERAIARLHHSKELISITTIAHPTEELCSLCGMRG
jgi:hypothetical protein